MCENTQIKNIKVYDGGIYYANQIQHYAKVIQIKTQNKQIVNKIGITMIYNIFLWVYLYLYCIYIKLNS